MTVNYCGKKRKKKNTHRIYSHFLSVFPFIPWNRMRFEVALNLKLHRFEWQPNLIVCSLCFWQNLLQHIIFEANILFSKIQLTVVTVYKFEIISIDTHTQKDTQNARCTCCHTNAHTQPLKKMCNSIVYLQQKIMWTHHIFWALECAWPRAHYTFILGLQFIRLACRRNQMTLLESIYTILFS